MINLVAQISAYLIIAIGCLGLLSLLMTLIYVLAKRLLIQFWVGFTMAGYLSYLHDKYTKGLPTKRIRMRNERDLYPDKKDKDD